MELKYTLISQSLEEMQDEIRATPNYKTDPILKGRIEALQWALDAVGWVFRISYHLNGLNTLHNYLDEKIEEEEIN